MEIIACGKGHYYNPEIYSECPECAKRKEQELRIHEEYVYCPKCRILLEDNVFFSPMCPSCGGQTKVLLQGDEELFSTLTLWQGLVDPIVPEIPENRLTIPEILQWYRERGIQLSEECLSLGYGDCAYEITYGDEYRREVEEYDANHNLIRRTYMARDPDIPDTEPLDPEEPVVPEEEDECSRRRRLYHAVETEIFNAIDRGQLQKSIDAVCHLLVQHRGNLKENTARSSRTYPTPWFDPAEIIRGLCRNEQYRNYLGSLEYMDAFPSNMFAAEILCKLYRYQREERMPWEPEEAAYAKDMDILRMLLRLDDLLAQWQKENNR